MTRQLRTLLSTALGVLVIGAAPAAGAQVFEDFDGIDPATVGTFAGNPAGDAGAGVGTTTGQDGSADNGLRLGFNPGSGDAFAGFAVEAPGTGLDVSASEYFTFYIRPELNADNVPVTLEVNLQEDANGDGTYDPATEDEYQALYRLETAGGTVDDGYMLVQIPLLSFTDDNSVNPGSDDGFDFSRVKFVVMAIGGVSGSELAISFDEFVFGDRIATIGSPLVFEDFDGIDPATVGTFAGNPAGDAGAGVGTTTGQDGSADNGLRLGFNPGSGDAFAGFAVEAPGTGLDVSASEYFTFYIRPELNADNVPVTLEVNLQEDANGDGTYDPATEDEYQALYRLETAGGTVDDGYMLVQIPLLSFTDDNSVNPGSDDGFDFSRVKFVVMAIGGVSGSELAISFDEFVFASGVITAAELPPSLDAAPVAFPNPASARAAVSFTLAEAADVAVDVVDLLGRTVATLADGARAAGPVRLDVETAGLAPGLYVVRVRTESGVATTRLTVVR